MFYTAEGDGHECYAFWSVWIFVLSIVYSNWISTMWFDVTFHLDISKTVIQQLTFVPFFHFGIFVPCFGFYGSQLFGFSSRSPTQSSCPAGNTASRLLDVIIGNFSTKPLNRVTIWQHSCLCSDFRGNAPDTKFGMLFVVLFVQVSIFNIASKNIQVTALLELFF